MLAELRNNSKTLAARLREAPNITAGQQDRKEIVNREA